MDEVLATLEQEQWRVLQHGHIVDKHAGRKQDVAHVTDLENQCGLAGAWSEPTEGHRLEPGIAPSTSRTVAAGGESGHADILSRHVRGAEGTVHLELGELSSLPAGTLDADPHRVVEGRAIRKLIDPEGIFVAHEVENGLHRIEGAGRYLEG